jgi:hypothetical protein
MTIPCAFFCGPDLQQRIVFICVPHRGSDLAINWIGSLGTGLISLPGKLLGGALDVVTAPLEKGVGLKHMPTGINGLSPRSPVLRGLDTLPIHAPYHTIVGDRGRGDTPNSSDGVVAYWSSHLTGAKSELIVPGPHGSFALPQTVSELKRILRLNLTAVSAPHQNTMPKGQRSAAGSSSERADRSETPAPQAAGESNSEKLGVAVDCLSIPVRQASAHNRRA